MDFAGPVACSTLADSNELRDWRIYAGSPRWAICRVRTTDPAGRTQSLHVRRDGGRIYQRAGAGDEMLLVDFDVPLNGSFTTMQRMNRVTVTYRANHEKLRLHGMEFSDVRGYSHAMAGGTDYRAYFARGIGLVGMTWIDASLETLRVSAQVGGRTVGGTPPRN
jgi:hypothetical protein